MSAYERLEPSFAELDSGDEQLHQLFQDEFEPELETPRRRIPVLIIGSLLLVALVGGGLAFAYKQGVREGNRSAPPVITSSNKPLKVKPVQPGGIIIPNQNKLVYDRLDGKPAKITERLMPAPEDVMELPKKPNQDRMPSAEGSMPAAAEGPSADAAPRVAGSSVTDIPPAPVKSADATPLRSREVETFTITPQGVYRNSAPPETPARETVAMPSAARTSARVAAAPAAEDAAPVITEIRPTKTRDDAADTAPEPARDTASSEPDNGMSGGKSNAAVPVDGGIASMARPAGSEPAPAPRETIAAGETVMAPGGQPDTGSNGAVPLPRPNPLRTASLDKAAPVVSAPVKTTDLAPPAAAAEDGRYVVQIASHRRQVDALTEFSRLQRKSPEAVGNYKPLIQRADLGERGIYYRLRIGPLASKEDAVRLCASLKAAGKPECLIRRR